MNNLVANLLTIDIGNSHTVVGIWQGAFLKASCRFLSHAQTSAQSWKDILFDCLEKNLKEKTITNKKFDVVLSSVVPQVKKQLLLALKPISKSFLFADENAKLPFVFDYLGTKTLGEDRIANAVAATYYYGENVIVVDFGTAITFCLLTKNIYQGGIILPGVKTAMDALAKKTSQLPSVAFAIEKNLIGKTTSEALIKGMFFGSRAMIKELTAQFKQEALLQGAAQVRVVATGGIVEHLGFAHEFFDVVDTNLTLRGLYQLYCFNL